MNTSLNRESKLNSRFSLYLTEKLPNAALLFGVIFLISLIGILTRPSGLLATFWPANAILLGTLIRKPKLANISGWIAAIIGYILADTITASPLGLSVALTIGNIVGVAIGYILFSRLPEMHRQLKQPISILYLVVIVTLASAASGAVGAIVNPIFFNGTSLQGAAYWYVTELVNYLTILPVILTIPHFWIWPFNTRKKTNSLKSSVLISTPFIVLICGLILQVLVGGPGSLTFIAPGLLWCALSYGLFTTALMTLFASIWSLLAFSMGYLNMGVNIQSQLSLESLRLGITLLSLAPLTVASVMDNRSELLNKLQFSATHDQLTSVLNRTGFNEKTRSLLDQIKQFSWPVSVLMLDSDNFKKINDQYGHASGDKVLTEFSRLTSMNLRETDLFGRLGGEEFAIVLPNCTLNEAQSIAQRICNTFAQHEFIFDNGERIKATVSIGVTSTTDLSISLEDMLKIADNNLYAAKVAGRNQVKSNNF